MFRLGLLLEDSMSEQDGEESQASMTAESTPARKRSRMALKMERQAHLKRYVLSVLTSLQVVYYLVTSDQLNYWLALFYLKVYRKLAIVYIHIKHCLFLYLIKVYSLTKFVSMVL